MHRSTTHVDDEGTHQSFNSFVSSAGWPVRGRSDPVATSRERQRRTTIRAEAELPPSEIYLLGRCRVFPGPASPEKLCAAALQAATMPMNNGRVLGFPNRGTESACKISTMSFAIRSCISLISWKLGPGCAGLVRQPAAITGRFKRGCWVGTPWRKSRRSKGLIKQCACVSPHACRVSERLRAAWPACHFRQTAPSVCNTATS